MVIPLGIFRTDDPIRDFERHEAKQESWLARRPVCADCEQHIQEETAYYINGEWLCQGCMSTYLVEVRDYIE